MKPDERVSQIVGGLDSRLATLESLELRGGDILPILSVGEGVAVGDAASAAPLSSVIDNWEDQDASEYSGDTANVSVVSTNVANGHYAAEIAAGESEILSTSGLNTYPAQGDVWRWNTYILSGGKPRFYWGVKDASNFYYLEYDEPNGTLRFVKQDAGTDTVIDTAAVTFDTGAYSETEVEWRTNGRHLIEYFDSTGTSQATIDATDTAFTSGGVGWGEWSVGTITNNLIAWYTFEDSGSTATLNDQATTYGDSDADDLNIYGMNYSTDAKVGSYAGDFDGVDDEAQNLGGVSIPSGPQTQGAWVKLDAVESGGNGVDQQFIISVAMDIRNAADGRFDAFYYDSSTGTIYRAESGYLPATGNWNHVVGVIDSNNIRVYVNGDRKDSTPTGGATPGSSDSVAIGNIASTATDRGTNGRIDDARIYAKALSDDEVSQWYNNTK